jgi:hypothetical protein
MAVQPWAIQRRVADHEVVADRDREIVVEHGQQGEPSPGLRVARGDRSELAGRKHQHRGWPRGNNAHPPRPAGNDRTLPKPCARQHEMPDVRGLRTRRDFESDSTRGNAEDCSRRVTDTEDVFATLMTSDDAS